MDRNRLAITDVNFKLAVFFFQLEIIAFMFFKKKATAVL
jgi:hypothetical protein